MPDEIRIDRLVLRVPAASRDDGRRIAETAVGILARTLPADLPRRTIGVARTRVAAKDRDADAAGTVAEAILRSLR